MQHLQILSQKLKFIKWFFERTTLPFIEIKRKIEAGEPPYEPNMSDEDGEPPFALQWSDADEGLQLQGQLCLNLLQRSLWEYLDGNVRRSRSHRPSKKNNWFENYKNWFVERGVDWSASGADLSLIEELTLARNRVQHGSTRDAHSLLKRQDEDYLERFPNALFQSDFEARVFRNIGPKLRTIELTDLKLDRAAEEIMKLANFIEANFQS